MTTFVDIGANLTNKAFRADLPAVLARSQQAGVRVVVVTGTSVQGSLDARAMALEHGARGVRLASTAGVHPHHASSYGPLALATLRELCEKPEVVAVGECGLDWERNLSPRAAQLACLAGQLDLAAEVRLPVFLHERGAHADFLAILREHRARIGSAVVHCFTGDRRALDAYLELDLHIGITGWICDERRGKHLVELMKSIPMNRLMIETDAPYLVPRNMPRAASNRRNEPAFLPYVLEAVARARGERPEDVARGTTEAATRFFGLRG